MTYYFFLSEYNQFWNGCVMGLAIFARQKGKARAAKHLVVCQALQGAACGATGAWLALGGWGVGGNRNWLTTAEGRA